jgi:N utilization substance protein B
MKPLARRLARQYALQALYQWQISQTLPDETQSQFFTHINKKTDVDYFRELIHQIPAQHTELDNYITPFLSRPIDEVDPIELAILRLSTYELANRPDVPYRVVINEALELTKKYGSIEGYKFVNSVLDHVAQKLRTHEIAKNE